MEPNDLNESNEMEKREADAPDQSKPASGHDCESPSECPGEPSIGTDEPGAAEQEGDTAIEKKHSDAPADQPSTNDKPSAEASSGQETTDSESNQQDSAAIPAPPTTPIGKPNPSEQSPTTDEAANIKKKPRFSKRTKLIALITGIVAVVAIVLANTICLHPNWEPATCTKPKTCAKCGAVAGEPLGHKWAEATCTSPKKCKRCGTRKGVALEHQEGEWTVETEATCTTEGTEVTTCKRCKKKLTRPIPTTEHQPGDWTVTVQPTTTSDGTRVRTCTVCGAEVESETFSMSPEELAAAYKAECASVSFDEVARNPDQYDNAKVRFTGEVIQVMEESGVYTLRVDVTKTSWGYDDTILVHYIAPAGAPRILEDDVITLFGTMGGMTSYESVMGATITLPVMYAQYVE